jgi:hypothetical protein
MYWLQIEIMLGNWIKGRGIDKKWKTYRLSKNATQILRSVKKRNKWGRKQVRYIKNIYPWKHKYASKQINYK